MDTKQVTVKMDMDLYQQARKVAYYMNISIAELLRKSLKASTANYLAKMNTQSANEKDTEQDTRYDGENSIKQISSSASKLDTDPDTELADKLDFNEILSNMNI